VGCRAAIAEETAVGGKYRPAVDADVTHPPGGVAMVVLEIAERFVPLQQRHVRAPFLRLGLTANRDIEAAPADQRGAIHAERVQPFRDVSEGVIWPGLPEPVGGGLGVIAKPLLALAHVLLRLPADRKVPLQP